MDSDEEDSMYIAVLLENLSAWRPISLHTHCRIVSSSVDLRTSKVCELGLLNYNAKNVFYPVERKKYRCHYDYYWASVFKVEYIDHLGHIKFAFAEAPNEALPYNCRPTFSGAWLTKNKFKVNETYECWYALGVSKVYINHEGLFDCRAHDPSTVEMIKRYYILFMRILKSSFINWRCSNQWRWDAMAGFKTSVLTSILTITLLALLRPLVLSCSRLFGSRSMTRYPNNTIILLKRACFFTVYFSFMSWITLQYLKRLGFT